MAGANVFGSPVFQFRKDGRLDVDASLTVIANDIADDDLATYSKAFYASASTIAETIEAKFGTNRASADGPNEFNHDAHRVPVEAGPATS